MENLRRMIKNWLRRKTDNCQEAGWAIIFVWYDDDEIAKSWSDPWPDEWKKFSETKEVVYFTKRLNVLSIFNNKPFRENFQSFC